MIEGKLKLNMEDDYDWLLDVRYDKIKANQSHSIYIILVACVWPCTHEASGNGFSQRITGSPERESKFQQETQQ